MSSSIQPKPVRVFSKEQPCTKVELFNCFWDPKDRGWIRRAVIEARGEIGENAPIYLLKKGYARTVQRQFVDWYELTETGKSWLVAGLLAYLKRHPDKWAEVSDPLGIRAWAELEDTAPKGVGTAPAPGPTVRYGTARRVVRKR